MALMAALLAQSAFAGANTATGVEAQENRPDRWIFTGLYSRSDLSGGRDDWNVANLELLYRASPKLILGGGLDLLDRGQGTDTLYSALFLYQASPTLEWHGAMRFASDPEFSALQKYTAGVEWRTGPRQSLLFDLDRLNFPEGPIYQYKPGVTYWFSERSYLTGRYVYGRAFHEEHYDAVSVTLGLGLSDGRRLSLGIAHGADPEKDPAVPGVILTTADTYSLYYRTPLRASLDLVVGVEYEDRRDIYRRSTATLGFVKRF